MVPAGTKGETTIAGTRTPRLSKAKLCVFSRAFSADPDGSAVGGVTWSKKPPCSSKTTSSTLLGQRLDVLIASYTCLTSASPLRTSPAGCIELPLRKSFFASYVGSMKMNFSVRELLASRERIVSIPTNRLSRFCIPWMARVCATSPCTMSQSDTWSFEKTVPFGKVKSGALKNMASTTCASLGEWSSPEEVPATAKKRFGHVGPGIDANQLSHTPNCRARKFSTGSWSGVNAQKASATSSEWSSYVAAKPVVEVSVANGG